MFAEVHTVQERMKSSWAPPKSVIGIRFEGVDGSETDAKRLTAYFLEKSFPRIQSVFIGETSHLLSLDILSCFPRLQSLTIESRWVTCISGLTQCVMLTNLALECSRRKLDLRDCLDLLPGAPLNSVSLFPKGAQELEQVNRLGDLQVLCLISCPIGDLSFLKIPVERLVAVRGRFSAVGPNHLGVRRETTFAAVSALTSVQGLRTSGLSIDGCKNLRLDTLGGVEGLRDLKLLAIGRLEDFSFLRQCRELRSFVLTATSLPSPKAVDYSPFVDHPSLRSVWLPAGARVRQVAELSRGAPSVAFSANGNHYFLNGAEIESDAFFEISRQDTT